MDFYAYLLKVMEFDVYKISYFLVCNVKRYKEEFNKRFNFDEFLVPYDWNIDWIEEEINTIVSLMNNDQISEPNLSCKKCVYSEQYAKLIYNPLKDKKRDSGKSFSALSLAFIFYLCKLNFNEII